MNEKATEEEPLKVATAVAGLLAGIVAAVYVTGGLVIALRLFFDGFEFGSVGTIVGQLPRELVITTALLDVGLPAVAVGLLVTMIAAVVAVLDLTPEDKKNSRRSAVAFLLLAIVFGIPAILLAAHTNGWSLLLLTSVAGILVTFLIGFALWRMIKRVANEGWPATVRMMAVGGLGALIAVVPALMFASARDFEQAQVCTVTGLLPEKGLLIGEGGGRVLLETNFSREESVVSLPEERVTKSEYGDLTSTFLCPPPPGALAAEEIAEVRLGGHGGKAERRLAMSLRPRLRFDGRERWRPLEVERFVGERFARNAGHGACAQNAEPPCARVEGLAALRRRQLAESGAPRPIAYLDIHGIERNGGDFTAPDRPCRRAEPVVDCDEGRDSVIYYRRTSHEGRWYWDYWWFFRYNDYNGKVNDCEVICGDHEGDWEGMTVVTTPSLRPQILGATYAAHKERVWVDGKLLPLAGSHPLGFVAEGTHATYPFACSRGERCDQYSGWLGFNLPEEAHDGAAPWGGNRDAECLVNECVRPLPEIGRPDDAALPLAGAWAGWPGKWGESCHNGCTGRYELYEASPRSPGNQSRFKCPWVATRIAQPAADFSGLSDSDEAGDAERLEAACAARRGGR